MVEHAAISPGSGSQHEPNISDAICQKVTEQVAATENISPTDLEPLQTVVDVGALCSLFAPTGTGTQRAGDVEFLYHGYLITVAVVASRVAVTVEEQSGQTGKQSE